MVRSENKWTFLLYRAWVQLSPYVMLTMFYTNVEFLMRKSYLSCSKDFEQTKTKSVNSCGFKIRRYFTWKKATTSFGCGFRVQLKSKNLNFVTAYNGQFLSNKLRVFLVVHCTWRKT